MFNEYVDSVLTLMRVQVQHILVVKGNDLPEIFNMNSQCPHTKRIKPLQWATSHVIGQFSSPISSKGLPLFDPLKKLLN